MKATDLLANTLETSLGVLERFAGPLSPDEMLHRPCDGANCAAWLIGHLALTERMFLTRAGVEEAAMPDLPDGFEERFSRSETAPKAAEFGDTSGLLPLLRRHRDLLIRHVRQMSDNDLGRAIEPEHPMFKTLGDALSFASTHMSVHAGQITIIRRSLGMPPLV